MKEQKRILIVELPSRKAPKEPTANRIHWSHSCSLDFRGTSGSCDSRTFLAGPSANLDLDQRTANLKTIPSGRAEVIHSSDIIWVIKKS